MPFKHRFGQFLLLDVDMKDDSSCVCLTSHMVVMLAIVWAGSSRAMTCLKFG